VRDSVLLHDVKVGAGARVERAIVDDRAEVEPGARVKGEGDEIALVARRARVEAA
jgi:ADP-glucose pyrophosphorylase